VSRFDVIHHKVCYIGDSLSIGLCGFNARHVPFKHILGHLSLCYDLNKEIDKKDEDKNKNI